MNEQCRIRHMLLPNGLRVGYESRGAGQLVLFLHGFPDTHRGFLPAMEAAAAAGYHAVAPEPRGYLPTALPADEDYRIARLAEDVLHIADRFGAEQFTIVGHDLGAMTGYATANLAPHRVHRLITASVPHTGCFLLNVRALQAFRSRYIGFFQLPKLPERTIARDDFAYIKTLIHRWAPSWPLTDTAWEPVRRNLQDPARVRAMLAYYRQLPASLSDATSRRLIFDRVQTPTRIIYGTNDRCIGPRMFTHQDRYFTHPPELVSMDVGHFPQWEAPQRFITHVLDFLPGPIEQADGPAQ